TPPARLKAAQRTALLTWEGSSHPSNFFHTGIAQFQNFRLLLSRRKPDTLFACSDLTNNSSTPNWPKSAPRVCGNRNARWHRRKGRRRGFEEARKSWCCAPTIIWAWLTIRESSPLRATRSTGGATEWLRCVSFAARRN